MLHNLAAPQTDLHELFIALDRVAPQTAPVAEANRPNYYIDLDTFFTAFASVSRVARRGHRGGPPSLEQAIHSLPHEAPFYENATEFMHLLRPSAAALRTVAPQLGHAFTRRRRQPRAPPPRSTRAWRESSPGACGIRAEPDRPARRSKTSPNTLEIGNPLLAGIAPEQANCNYWTLAFRNVASLETENIGVGTLARAGFVLSPTGPNNEGYPVLGAGQRALRPNTKPSRQHEIVDNNHLHVEPLPERRRPRPAAGLRSGQRELQSRKAGRP